jgi:hypothetical protein
VVNSVVWLHMLFSPYQCVYGAKFVNIYLYICDKIVLLNRYIYVCVYIYTHVTSLTLSLSLSLSTCDVTLKGYRSLGGVFRHCNF